MSAERTPINAPTRPFSLAIPDDAWEECGSSNRLLAQIEINGTPLHLEAWKVVEGDIGVGYEQMAVEYDEDLAKTFTSVGADAPCRTTSIRDAEYVLVATPRCI